MIMSLHHALLLMPYPLIIMLSLHHQLLLILYPFHLVSIMLSLHHPLPLMPYLFHSMIIMLSQHHQLLLMLYPFHSMMSVRHPLLLMLSPFFLTMSQRHPLLLMPFHQYNVVVSKPSTTANANSVPFNDVSTPSASANAVSVPFTHCNVAPSPYSTELLTSAEITPTYVKSRNWGNFAALLVEKLFYVPTRLRSNVNGFKKEQLDPKVINYAYHKALTTMNVNHQRRKMNGVVV